MLSDAEGRQIYSGLIVYAFRATFKSTSDTMRNYA